MKYFDMRNPSMSHLYYVYVYPSEGDEKSDCSLYRLGSVKEIKRKMRGQQRKIDIVKVW